jgi:GT2 family glycosyltransferase
MDSLSVIILHHNTFDMTCKCISSIYQTNKSIRDVEVIVIDNGSDVDHKEPFLNLFPSIIYQRNSMNVGFAKGNNMGLKLASKENVLLLNSDVLITKEDTLFRCLKRIHDFKFPVVLSPGLLNENGEFQVCYGNLPSIKLELLLSLFIHKFLPKNWINKYLMEFSGPEQKLIDKGWLVAACLFFKRDLLGFLPGQKLYDQTYLYGEELFWGYHWHKHQVRQYYFPAEFVTHLVGQSSKIDPDYSKRRRRAFQIYGEYLFVNSLYPRLLVNVFYLIRLIRLTVLSLFKSDIRLIRSMTYDLLSSRFTDKYSFVINNQAHYHESRSG